MSKRMCQRDGDWRELEMVRFIIESIEDDRSLMCEFSGAMLFPWKIFFDSISANVAFQFHWARMKNIPRKSTGSYRIALFTRF